MKIIFIGTVEIGHTVLKAVYKTDSDINVQAIYTMPVEYKEKISGFVDFRNIANKYKTSLIRINNINDKKNIKQIQELEPDLIIVCGWQRLICEEILKIPKRGTIGFHTSLLPKYRGRAPVNWAILLGEKETGITMFYLTPRADDGDIIAQKSFPILFNDDCHTIYKKSARAGAELIKKYLPNIADETVVKKHNPSATYPEYPKRTPKEGIIDFNRSSLDIYNFVRALTKPYPGAYYYNEQGERIIVWRIEIVFNDNRIQSNDILFDTLDYKVRIAEYDVQSV